MRRNNSWAWAKVYIVFPLIPVFLASLIRYVVKQPFYPWQAISPADVSLSMGILSIFVTQATLTKVVPLEDDLDRQIRYGVAAEFQGLTLISFVLFAILTFIDVLDSTNHALIEQMKMPALDIAVLITALVTVIKSILAQQTFKLDVSA